MQYKTTAKAQYLLLLFTLCVFACGEDTAMPKPRGFPKVNYPSKSYQAYKESCPFTFEYPSYANILQDSSKGTSNCWFNIDYPDFNARLHCSYYPMGNKTAFEKLRGDAFNLADKHDMRADYIDELPFHNPAKNVHGFVFNIEGPAASPFQFYLTDSTKHFFRAALYFNTQSRPDSLAPIFDFIKKDMMKMANSFEWK